MKSSVRVEGNFDDVWSDKNALGRCLDPPSPNEPDQNNPAHPVSNGVTTNLHINKNVINETNPNGGGGSELDDKVAAYGKENWDLKMQLMAAQDEVRTLTQQNQKEKAKNVKATTEMLQLKADYQQASDEKHKLELQIKNLDARLREKEELLEKLESAPRPSGDRGGNGLKTSIRRGIANGNGGGDHLVTQISDLMAENDALLDKLEFEKTASSHEIKKKEEQVLFLSEELKKLREENDMLLQGECEKDPLMGKLLQQKKVLEDQLQQEKEVMGIRIQGMKEMIESLQKANADLKKELEKATLEIKDDDDDEIRRAKEMAQAVSKTGTKNAREARRASQKINRGENLNGSNSAFGFGLKSLSELAQRK
jgi:chromosome segregation ATPase